RPFRDLMYAAQAKEVPVFLSSRLRILRGAAFVLPAMALFGQSQTGRITGKITDPAGAAVPAANVIITEQDTGVHSKGVSSGTGVYVVPFLPPGRYSVEVSHSGFKEYERPNIALGTSEALPLDIQLELGNVSEKMTVDARTVADMPLNGRRALSL